MKPIPKEELAQDQVSGVLEVAGSVQEAGKAGPLLSPRRRSSPCTPGVSAAPTASAWPTAAAWSSTVRTRRSAIHACIRFQRRAPDRRPGLPTGAVFPNPGCLREIHTLSGRVCRPAERCRHSGRLVRHTVFPQRHRAVHPAARRPAAGGIIFRSSLHLRQHRVIGKRRNPIPCRRARLSLLLWLVPTIAFSATL